MTLFELLDHRIVTVDTKPDDVAHALSEVTRQVPTLGPLAGVLQAASGGERSYRLLKPSAGVVVVDLGPDPTRGAVLGCVPSGFDVEGERKSVVWILTGLERPVVNLQVVPGLQKFHEEFDPFHLCAGGSTNPAIEKHLSAVSVAEILRVEHVLTPLSYRIYPDTPVSEVMDLMVRRRVAAVPVVGADLGVLGVITTGDILPHVLPASGASPKGGWTTETTARDVMTRTVLCVSEEEGLVEATRKMLARGVSQLPVVREGELIGFLDRQTVMRALSPSGGIAP